MKVRFDNEKAAKVLEVHGVEMEMVRNEVLEGRFTLQ